MNAPQEEQQDTCQAKHPTTGNPCVRTGEHDTHNAMGTQRMQLFGDSLQMAEASNVPALAPAGEALVQQIAEAAMQAMGCREYEGPQDGEHYCAEHQHLWLDNRGCQDALVAARAALPLVEARVAPLRDEVARLRAQVAAVEALADELVGEVQRLFHSENAPREAGRVEGVRQRLSAALASVGRTEPAPEADVRRLTEELAATEALLQVDVREALAARSDKRQEILTGMSHEPVTVMACGSMDDYASAFNDGFARALELVREDLDDYCDPDDDADTAAILRDYAMHLDTWRLAHEPAKDAPEQILAIHLRRQESLRSDPNWRPDQCTKCGVDWPCEPIREVARALGACPRCSGHGCSHCNNIGQWATGKDS